ncbi:hypothetical protein J2T17_000334 [Paenibacillus mucilaginosus]|uniref:hypothetical protein n=1 Tax=Paenibacillus mucilaginosus TaxID=61624 RepID=UPI003D259F1A
MLPTLLTAFLATTAFRFEISVAESVILGMVGAGSLGILMVFFTMFLLEMGTVRIRKRIAKQG